MESDRTNLTVRHGVGDNCCYCIVRGICFNDPRKSRIEMGEDGSCSKLLFERIERSKTIVGEVPSNVLLGEAGERNANVGVAVDEATIEISKAEERLDVLDVTRDGPVEDLLNLFGVHANAVLANDIAKIFDFFSMEFAFLRLAEEVVLTQSFKDFSDVARMIRRIVRKYE